MALVIGPVLTRTGGYAFDVWTPEQGLSRGYVYRRVEDAYHARKAELRSSGERHAYRRIRGSWFAVPQPDEFIDGVAGHDAPLVVRAAGGSVASVAAPQRTDYGRRHGRPELTNGQFL
jgi:hypothetical protein